MIPQATTELEAQTSPKAIKLSNLLGAKLLRVIQPQK
jgi:hypothetical protein